MMCEDGCGVLRVEKHREEKDLDFMERLRGEKLEHIGVREK